MKLIPLGAVDADACADGVCSVPESAADASAAVPSTQPGEVAGDSE